MRPGTHDNRVPLRPHLDPCDQVSQNPAPAFFQLLRPVPERARRHASTRPTNLTLDPAAKWLGLDVLSHTTQDADHAEVEFVARYREGGRAVRLRERSDFVRESGRWFYVDGDPF